MSTPRPTCFISYSWDSQEHRDWVFRLGQELAASGIDISLDRDVKPGESVTHFMEAAIRDSDVVLIVCTPRYAEKANGRIGGVGYETGIVTGALFQAASSAKSKFVPILRTGSFQSALPTYLSDKLAIDFRLQHRYRESLLELIEHCGGQPPAEARKPLKRTKKGSRKAKPKSVPSLRTKDLKRMMDSGQKPVVVEFWAPWCGPCRVLAPVVDELAGEFGESTEFARINVDEEQSFAAEHEVLSIPTMMVFHGQTLKKKVIGAMPKERLLAELRDYIGELEPAVSSDETIALTWHRGRIRAAQLSADGTYSYVSTDANRLGLVYLPKFVKTDFASAIAELEELLNDSYAGKDEIRAFLQAHPDVILGGEYKAAHSQVLLRREGSQSLQPDFMLEPIGGDLADIVEVEPAQRQVATEVDGVTELTEVVMQACARLRESRDHFESERHRVEIEDEHGIRVFRPKMFVVIGRSGQTDSLTRRRLETQLTDVTLRSWDDVLAVARDRLSP